MAGRCPPQDWETSLVIALASRLVLSSSNPASGLASVSVPRLAGLLSVLCDWVRQLGAILNVL